jgi:hypothetical protein
MGRLHYNQPVYHQAVQIIAEELQMSTNMNQEKSRQLGINHSTANAKLRKNILFHLISKYGDNFCFQCGAEIESVDDLSIEHKVPWLHNSPDLYWDMENIAFSHLVCNVGAARKPNKIDIPEGMGWCKYCKTFKNESEFCSDKVYGIRRECRECGTINRRIYRNKNKSG